MKTVRILSFFVALTATRLTAQDFLDLQVWHKLAWVDPLYLDADARVRRLVEKQRGFSEADKAVFGKSRTRFQFGIDVGAKPPRVEIETDFTADLADRMRGDQRDRPTIRQRAVR